MTLGRAFGDLRRTDQTTLCQDPDAEERRAGLVTARYTSTIYGTCDAGPDDDCAPPLEIQNWPECARDYRSFAPEQPDGSLTLRRSRALIGSEVPAARITPTQIEVYSGPTTIVVFSSSKALANRAARAVGRRISASTSFGHLRAQAERRPGCD